MIIFYNITLSRNIVLSWICRYDREKKAYQKGSVEKAADARDELRKAKNNNKTDNASNAAEEEMALSDDHDEDADEDLEDDDSDWRSSLFSRRKRWRWAGWKRKKKWLRLKKNCTKKQQHQVLNARSESSVCPLKLNSWGSSGLEFEETSSLS